MSGAETVAGLVLGVLPLLVFTLENYDITFRPFSRYRNFSREVCRFEKHLLSQKTIFKNECRLLLSSLTDRHEVDQMLEQGRAHISWDDKEMSARLLQHLGSSSEACVSTIELIVDKLREIDSESYGFMKVLSGAEVDNPILQYVKWPNAMQQELLGDKVWRKKIKEKLSFSVSKSKLQAYIEDLRSLNKDFMNISGQTMRLETECANRTRQVQVKNANKAVVAFQIVQKASQKLYEALTNSCSCTKHTDHSAHLCLEAEMSFNRDSTEPQVRFEIAFKSLGIGVRAPVLELFWLSIESTIMQVQGELGQGRIAAERTGLGGTNHLVHLTKTLKRQAENISAVAGDATMPPPAPRKRLKKKSVTFEKCSSLQDQPCPPEVTPSTLQPSLPDLCLRRNFCLQIQNFCTQDPESQSRCIGFLEHTENSKHLVYQSLRHRRLNNNNPVTLATLLSRSSNASTNLHAFDSGLPNWVIIRLAKCFSRAVLQFHETPWMRKACRSQDVVFFGLPSSSNTTGLAQTYESLSSPHLNVQIVPSQTSVVAPPTQIQLARNGYLFDLGVLLLELARQKPFASLQRPEDLRSADLGSADFYTARRESRTLGSELGPRYAKVVRQCLECDFGVGDDLTERELQDKVYRDVVCELERLEAAFQKIHLGD